MGDDPRAPWKAHAGLESSFEDELTPILQMEPEPSLVEKRPCLVLLSGPRIGEIFAIADAPEGFTIGRDPKAPLRLIEEGVSRFHARIELHPAGGARITDLGSTNGTLVEENRIQARELDEGDKIRIGATVLRFTYYDPLEEACQRQLLEAALRDGLTRAFNRRYFLERLAAETAFADRQRRPLTLLMIDIDHFKAVNDTFGHVAGDIVLRRVGEVMLRTIRADDVLARYGGEEFVILARDTTLEGGTRLAERLRSAIAATRFEHQARPVDVRVSIGVASLPEASGRGDALGLLERADQALYRAKRDGRDRVSG